MRPVITDDDRAAAPPAEDPVDPHNGGAAVEQDASGAITEWNEAAERLFGWSRAEAIGRQSDILVPQRNAERSRTARTLAA